MLKWLTSKRGHSALPDLNAIDVTPWQTESGRGARKFDEGTRKARNDECYFGTFVVIRFALRSMPLLHSTEVARFQLHHRNLQK